MNLPVGLIAIFILVSGIVKTFSTFLWHELIKGDTLYYLIMGCIGNVELFVEDTNDYQATEYGDPSVFVDFKHFVLVAF